MRRKIFKEDILKAGLELMFQNGFNGTGIKDITDNIDIPKGSFYNHFSSKEQFGLEVVKHYCDNGVIMYENRFLKSSLPAIQRFDDFFTTLIANYKDSMNCKLGCIMSNFSAELADTNENFRTLLDTEFKRCQDIMAACLKEAQQDGDLNNKVNTDELASYILNGWHGALVRMKSTASAEPLETFRKITNTYLLQ